VVIGQQLTHHTCSVLSTSQQQCTQQQLQHEQAQGTQEQQQQQETLALFKACCSYCELASTVLSAAEQQQQQQQQPTKHRRHVQQQQQQPQQLQVQLLPSQAATAVCSCLRQWADMHQGQTFSSSTSSSGNAELGEMQCRLQVAAINAIGVLLPQQLPALAVHERAAVLTLLQSLAQLRPATGSSLWSSAAGASAGPQLHCRKCSCACPRAAMQESQQLRPVNGREQQYNTHTCRCFDCRLLQQQRQHKWQWRQQQQG
jgi:hypothetical protein